MAKIKNSGHTTCWHNVEEKNFHSLSVETENTTNTLGKKYSVSYKSNYKSIMYSSHSTPSIYPRKKKACEWPKNWKHKYIYIRGTSL